MEIVGESHYQTAIRKALHEGKPTGDGRTTIEVRVQCESDSKYDPHACRVVSMRGDILGYLARERARKFHNAIAKVGGSVRCRGTISGDEILGVWLDLCDPWRIPGVKAQG
jgi:hypothetical protein